MLQNAAAQPQQHRLKSTMNSMSSQVRMPIRLKLSLLLFFIALCPLLIFNWLSFLSAQSALKAATLDGLNQSAEYKAGEIFLYLETLKTNTRDFASDGFITSQLTKTRQGATNQSISQHLINRKMPVSDDLLYIDVLNNHGVIIASTKDSRIGQSLGSTPIFIKGQSDVYVSEIKFDFSDHLSGAVAVPLLDRDSQPAGVLINHYKMDKLQQLFSGELISALSKQRPRFGFSSQQSIYLTNHNQQLLTHSSLNSVEISHINVNTTPMSSTLSSGKAMQGIWQDNRRNDVVGVSMIIGIDDFNYVLVAEKELSVAYQSIEQFTQQSLAIMVATSISVLIISWLAAYYITRPINRLIHHIDGVSHGEMNDEIVDIKIHDEFGLLVSKFKSMTQRVKHMHEELSVSNARLYQTSIKDELTGSYNRRHIIERGDYCIQEAKRYNKTLSSLMIDIDHFKSINDRFGHPFGDTVIKQIAIILEAETRSTDIICRYGGEEFVIIMPMTSLADAALVANKINRKVAQWTFRDLAQSLHTTISVGVAQYQSCDQNMLNLLARADKALYMAKNNGRNQVCCQSITESENTDKTEL